jgi:hypothetical protein
MSERQSISLRYHQEGTMSFSGIDQHKRDRVITTYAADGQRVKQQRVPNEPARLRAYFAAFPGPHRAVVESTGFWYWLADLLDDLGVDLVLAHAPRLKAIAAAKVKTDHLDADLLAQLLRADLGEIAGLDNALRNGVRHRCVSGRRDWHGRVLQAGAA